MLKALHPLMMTMIFAVCWGGQYASYYAGENYWMSCLMVSAAYAVVLIVLEKNYHAQEVGIIRISEMIYSQSLANLISAGIAYLMLSAYAHQMVNILPAFCTVVVQCGISAVWSVALNRVYFKNYVPPKTAIIYRNQADLAKVQSISYFSEHFDVQKMIENPEDNIHMLVKELKGIKVVFIAGVPATLRNGIVKYCMTYDITAYVVPHLGDVIMNGAEHMSMFAVPIMKVQRANCRTFYMLFKRMMDIILSLVGIVLVSPVIVVTACAIKLYDGGPALYRQVRLTVNGRRFMIMKFRSMRVNAEQDGVARLSSQNDDRITPVGKIIRAVRIDELPQLFNILRGEMSIVGPRPERPEIAAQYEQSMPEFALRLQVKAGLTGMAQVYGRYNTKPYDKLQMDLMYINKISLVTDFKLLLATIKILFLKESTEGVQEGQNTALSSEKQDEHKRSA